MNATRTDDQKRRRTNRAKLAKLQQDIANGLPPALPDGKQDVHEYHPTIPNFAARIYASGKGIWQLGYRTKDKHEKRTEKLGDMAVMTLQFAEKRAREVLNDVQQGRDPQAERRKLRLRPQRTVGQLCDEYFAEKAADQGTCIRTIRGYRSIAGLYLDVLRDMHFAELTAQDVATRVREISNQRDDRAPASRAGVARSRPGEGGPGRASHFKAMLSSVYRWGLGVYPDELKVNPVTGTWNPPKMKSTGQSLNMEELGAIWRACVALDAKAVSPMSHGAVMKPGHHISGADDELITCGQAGRLTGLHESVFHRAVQDGTLHYQYGVRKAIATSRRVPYHGSYKWTYEPGKNDDSARPSGEFSKGHTPRPAHLITVGDANRLVDMRPQSSSRRDYAKVVRLLMLLGARYMEIGGLRWSELNCDCSGCRERQRKFSGRFLHIPTVMPDGTRVPEHVGLRRIKSRAGEAKDLVLYLPQAALDIIDSVPRRPGCDWLFGNADGAGVPSSGLLKEYLDAEIVANEGAPLRPWKHHWLRHSFITHLQQDLECPPHFVAAMVNHLSKDVSRAHGGYDHTVYLQQQKRYLDIWANEIRKAADRVDDDQTNVRQFQRAETAT